MLEFPPTSATPSTEKKSNARKLAVDPWFCWSGFGGGDDGGGVVVEAAGIGGSAG